jgi:hypothetical protein
MFVIKRDGRQVPVRFDKITARIQRLSYGLNQTYCDPVSTMLGLCNACSAFRAALEPDKARGPNQQFERQAFQTWLHHRLPAGHPAGSIGTY